MTTIDKTGASAAEFEARVAPFEAEDAENELSVDACRYSPDGTARGTNSYTVELGGGTFTQDQWEAVLTWRAGTAALASPAPAPQDEERQR